MEPIDFEDNEQALYLVPDVLPKQELDAYNGKKIVSIYWLYLSSELMVCLPVEPFTDVRESPSSIAESLRVSNLLLESVKIMESDEIYSLLKVKLTNFSEDEP